MLIETTLNQITPTLPTTILGLIGLLFFYLYYSYKTKKDNELKAIQSIQSDKQKVEVIEKQLNEFGTKFTTGNLTPEQKYNLLLRLIKAKTQRILITAVTSIVVAIIIAIVLSINLGGTIESGDLRLKDLDLQAYFVNKNGASSSPLNEDELTDIAKLETFTNEEGDWLKLNFHFTEKQLSDDSTISFSFGEKFSKLLGPERANPVGWSTVSHDGTFTYSPTEFTDNLEFRVTYKKTK